MHTRISAAAAGLLVGLLGSWGLASVLGLGEDEVVEVAPTTTVSQSEPAPAAPRYLAEQEAIVGSAVLVPGELAMDGDSAVFRYELTSIAPLDGYEPAYVSSFLGDPGTPIAPEAVTPVFPAEWTLLTATGEFPGLTQGSAGRSARFDVPTSFSPSQATGLRLDSYRLPVPVNEQFVMSESAPTFAVAPGVTVSLIQVVDQGSQTIVQVEILAADAFNRENLSVEGVGTHWQSAVREAEGRPRWNLRYQGEDAPEELLLRVHGFVWLTVADPIDIPLGGA